MPIKKFKEIVESGEKVLLVFDYDNTLAPFNEQLTGETIDFLNKHLLQENIFLAINSMQSCEYLSGIARQAGLERSLILIGEGGAQIWYEHQMPCQKYMNPVITDEIRRKRLDYLGKVMSVMPEKVVYYDILHGVIGLLAHDHSIQPEVLYAMVKDADIQIEEPFFLEYNEHCLRIGIRGISKLETLQYLQGKLEIERLIAFGDSLGDDLPMLQLADLGIWFGEEVYATYRNVHHFPDILTFIKELSL